MSRIVPEWLAMRAARRPGEPALRSDTVVWQRAALLEAVDTLAGALAGEGIAAGDRVACLLADDVPAVVLVEAARRLGVVVVPLNRRLSVPELRAQLAAAGVVALLHDDEHSGHVHEVTTPATRPLAIEPLLASAPVDPGSRLRDEIDLDEPAVIVFTSGTTGRPRGVVLTYRALAASAHAWSHVLHPLAGDRWLLCLPLFHVAGLGVVTRAARWGAELALLPRFDPSALSLALDDGVTHVSLVPTQLRQLIEARDARPVPASLRAILVGGGPIPTDLLARARDAGYPVLTTYGLTETCSGIAVGGTDAATLADPSAVRPLPGVRLRIEPEAATDGAAGDTAAGDAAAGAAGAGTGHVGGSGEILVQGEMLFRGYAGDEDATASRLRDGWLRTGDIGSLDDEGLLRVLDRRDDLIVSGGENVAPAEVEAALAAHPDVLEAAVVGAPHPRWGAVPVAVVVLHPGSRASDEELQRHCRARLAGYKVPAWVERVEALPRNASGKVRRGELRERLTGIRA